MPRGLPQQRAKSSDLPAEGHDGSIAHAGDDRAKDLGKLGDAGQWESVLAAFRAAWPIRRWRDLGVLIGCSGGADSVALATAMCQLRHPGHSDQGGRDAEITTEPTGPAVRPGDPSFGSAEPRGFVMLAHFNHGIRGSDADADQQFVECLGKRLGVRCLVGRSHDQHRDEASMREERLRFLIAAAKANGCRYVALAHSADDNVETVLHHLLRGTGPAGLAGIGSPRALDEDLVLIRPLLEVRRSQIRAGLREIGRDWQEDESNNDLRYRRNWLRHELLPTIEAVFPHASNAVLRAIDGQREWRELVDRLADEWIERGLQIRPAARPRTRSERRTADCGGGSAANLAKGGAGREVR